jgi:aminoglycoside phosphotransferase (APT) family kinase protein
MALVNGADLVVTQKALSAWLAERLPGAADVVVSELASPPSSGFSNETLFFAVEWNAEGIRQARRLVARLQMPGPGLFPNYRLDHQFAVMAALGRAGSVPVPKVLWQEDDHGPLGTPFYVMEHVDGRVAGDDPPYTAEGWFIELSPEQRGVLVDNALAAMANVHKVDWQALGLDFLARPGHGDPLDREIAFYQYYFAWASAGQPDPTIESALEWVRHNRPTSPEPVVLSWGDARIGNILAGDDLSVRAVLDWEMATLGSASLDLGWWLFMQRHHTEGYGIGHPAGLPTRDEVIARYTQLSGAPPQYVGFYEAFAALRGAIIMARLAHMMIAAGMLPPDAEMVYNNPATRILADLCGLPAPLGVGMTGHVGRR